MIGNMQTVALVNKTNASIDWLCYPYFDSPSVFGRLLDAKAGGHFSISPAPSADLISKQVYFADSNVLITRYSQASGVGQVTDLMPVRKDRSWPWIIRKVEAVRGSIEFIVDCQPAFDYGRVGYNKTWKDQQCIKYSSEDGAHEIVLMVHGDHQMSDNNNTIALTEGRSVIFVLGDVRLDDSILTTTQQSLEELIKSTKVYWYEWLKQSTYKGRWREMVHRSVLALKLMTFAPTGAIIAAPTTSLPEDSWHREQGSKASRNWDYRFTWIRDAAFTVYAFLRVGFKEEAQQFMHWIEARCHELRKLGGGLRVLYDLNECHPDVCQDKYLEVELDHWEGYRGKGPVRIGNVAAQQVQLDIYGDLMDAIYLCDKHINPISWDFWQVIRETLIEPVVAGWHLPDHGIWEARGQEPQQYVHSKVMAWVALDRGIRLAQKRSLPADLTGWIRARDAVKEEVMLRGWNPKIQSFTQAYGSEELDASLLIMPLVFFISPADLRMTQTTEAILRNPRGSGLTTNNLVFRFGGSVDQEGTFTMCSFWLAEALARAGKVQQGRVMLEDLLSYANHVGLFSEEIDVSGRALGNFPQALTHMSLISAAFNIDRLL